GGMLRAIIGLVLGGAFGAAAGNAALVQIFGVGFEALWDRLDDRGPIFAAVVMLPILFLIVRGWLGWLVSALLMSVVMSAGLKLWLQDEMPWEQALTLTTIYALVAIAVYRLLISRVLG
ncbi:MAG: hypothetical protein AAGM38_08825, partial [Pseudomonadota bacterium]